MKAASRCFLFVCAFECEACAGQWDAPIATWTTQKMEKEFENISLAQYLAQSSKSILSTVGSTDRPNERTIDGKLCQCDNCFVTQKIYMRRSRTLIYCPLISLPALNRNYSNIWRAEERLAHKGRALPGVGQQKFHVQSPIEWTKMDYEIEWRDRHIWIGETFMHSMDAACLDFIYDLATYTHDGDDDDQVFRSLWIRFNKNKSKCNGLCQFLCVFGHIIHYIGDWGIGLRFERRNVFDYRLCANWKFVRDTRFDQNKWQHLSRR